MLRIWRLVARRSTCQAHKVGQYDRPSHAPSAFDRLLLGSLRHRWRADCTGSDSGVHRQDHRAGLVIVGVGVRPLAGFRGDGKPLVRLGLGREFAVVLEDDRW